MPATRHIRYDNLTSAAGESDLRAIPCPGGEPPVGTVPLALRVRPALLPTGISGAREKGGVEVRGGPVPPKPIVPDARCRFPR